jgi:hypothetical protein
VLTKLHMEAWILSLDSARYARQATHGQVGVIYCVMQDKFACHVIFCPSPRLRGKQYKVF